MMRICRHQHFLRNYTILTMLLFSVAIGASGCAMFKEESPEKRAARQQAQAAEAAEIKRGAGISGDLNDTEQSYVEDIRKKNEINRKAGNRSVFGFGF